MAAGPLLSDTEALSGSAVVGARWRWLVAFGALMVACLVALATR